MKTLDRRDCIKMMSGLLLTATGGMALPLAAQQTKPGPKGGATKGGYWKEIDQAGARDLVQNAIKAARAEVQAQREVNASKRAEVLMGADAAKEHTARASTHYEARTAALRATKDSFAHFVRTGAESKNKRFAAFAGKGGLKELARQARQTSIQAMLNSDISPQEAQAAVKALDERLAKVQSLNSFQEASSYLDQHLDELIARKMPEEDPNGLCVLILILASIFVVFVIIAALVCIFGGSTCVNNVLNSMLAQACP
jgi:hypothetical protein